MTDSSPSWPIDRDAYSRRLAIIVPYRDRAEHLRDFLPHIAAYFERDKLDRYIRYSVHIVEQLGDEAFNRGRLCNAGFTLTKDDADYFCFHDVDYLPIWADYSYVERPTRLIWHGVVMEENYERLFGGVVAFNRADFERINGFSNDYPGWGFEDSDLRRRCLHAGLMIDHRDGTFQPLMHPHQGYNQEGRATAAALANAARFNEKLGFAAELFNAEGLNTLEFVEVIRQPCTLDGKMLPNIVHHRISWSM